ncbi:hypothetical protein GC102_15035 [Paenibacillus sp. LMG 31460]|uniref:Uncharacterized protein n=1 Tax=Paenibacillus germinis TaxID=2654979 RepID=A0ABX1Z105_9BACL|nr:hypothetical protein [Paenibacillus germinis]NOU87085.1 hypothetical protein [Paenibacillus germinis]
METILYSLMQELLEKYKKLKIPNRFTLEEVENILKKKYLVIELDKKEFGDYEKISKCYSIQNEEVLNSLYSAEEKISIFIMLEHLKKEIKLSTKDIDEIHAGRRINIILESENQYISSFTIQGMSNKLVNELIVLKGIDSEKCTLENQEFLYYLQALLKSGYINNQ